MESPGTLLGYYPPRPLAPSTSVTIGVFPRSFASRTFLSRDSILTRLAELGIFHDDFADSLFIHDEPPE